MRVEKDVGFWSTFMCEPNLNHFKIEPVVGCGPTAVEAVEGRAKEISGDNYLRSLDVPSNVKGVQT